MIDVLEVAQLFDVTVEKTVPTLACAANRVNWSFAGKRYFYPGVIQVKLRDWRVLPVYCVGLRVYLMGIQ